MSESTARRRSDEAGFTLTEVLVASFILVVVLGGVLALLELNTDLARAQTQLADLQQSIRVAQAEMMQDVRMAGRGGLPRGALPDGVAVAVRNDVPSTGDERFVAIGDTDSPEVVPGTDVLTVRGVFSTPVYQIDTLAGSLSLDDTTIPTQGTVRVRNPIGPNVPVPQDLQALVDAEDGEALILVSPLGGFAVVAVDSSVAGHSDSDNTDVRIGFQIGTVGGTDRKDRYAALSNGFPPDLRSVAHVGILEEYRYYVRQRFAVSGDATSDLTPSLTRARVFPGTETAYSSGSLSEDVADNVFDLQIALGVDTDNSEIIEEDGTGGDDWLFNTRDDLDGTGAPQNLPKWNGSGGNPPSLYYVRLTTLARTDRRDPGYEAPLLTTVEDKDYSVSPFNDFNTREERMFRRRLLRTIVDMRNLS